MVIRRGKVTDIAWVFARMEMNMVSVVCILYRVKMSYN